MRILENWDVTSLYPSEIEIFGYSSRNQQDEQGYIDLLKMRKKAKKNLLTDDFLKPLGLTNNDLNGGLKLPLNTYTGALRAKFNDLYDNLQGFSICTTGQLLILQLIYDLQKVPTLEMVSANTDAVMYTIEEEYKEQAYKVLNDWQKLTGLELEEDKISKIIMANVNNYVEIVQIGDNDYKVNYKGGNFTGKHIFKWDKEKKVFHYEFKDDLKSNSMTIVSEAILKKLLFNMPVEETINNCNDIFRFQIISHLGSTYEKCVQESLNNDINIEDVEKCKKELYNLEEERDKILDNLTNNANDIECYNIEDLYDSTEYKEISSKINNINMKISSLLHPNDIVLQRNNRIYAGKKPSGIVVKIKSDGRRDSLANCPPNPIIDNANECTIDDVNKEWYIDLAKQRVNDFLGIKRIEDYKKDELLDKAKDYGLEIDKKTKKSELIKIIKEYEKRNEVDKMATKQELEEKLQKSVEQNEQLMEKLKEQKSITTDGINNEKLCHVRLLHKINEFRKRVREYNFVSDGVLPRNLGNNDYYKVSQFYDALQDIVLEVGLDFTFEVTDLISFDKDLVKISGSAPKHVATVKTLATFTDIDTGYSKSYTTIGQGADTIDKAVPSAGSMAFRHWFIKNFKPKDIDLNELDDIPEEQSKPKVPVYIPESKKEEIKKEVVQQKQQEEIDDEDIKEICENIMKVRDLTGNATWGEKAITALMSGVLEDADVHQIYLEVKNELKKVQNG